MYVNCSVLHVYSKHINCTVVNALHKRDWHGRRHLQFLERSEGADAILTPLNDTKESRSICATLRGFNDKK